MLVSSTHREFRALLDEQERLERKRYIDLQVVWRREATGEILYKAGGCWDNLRKCWSPKPAGHGRIINLEESQIEAARWGAWWMQEFKAGRPRDFFSLFLYGGRGSGKTHFATIFLITLIIEFPFIDATPAIAWQVSSSHNERDELDREIDANFPFKGSWYKYVEHPKHEYRFVHGPRLVNVSADDAQDLKRGRVDFLLINEAQKMSKQVPTYGLARLADKGGLAVFTSNPPTESKAQWILDQHDQEKEAQLAGNSYPIKFLHLDPSLNKHRDTHVAGQIGDVLRVLDPRLAQADIDGMMLRIGQPAYWEWNKTRNARAMPDLGDITREYTKRRTGRAYDYIAGADFQDTPHMAAAIFKIYGSYEKPMLWVVDEFVAEQATEDDLLDLVDEAGYVPEELLWVGDASGQWQDGKHKKGRDSFQVFKSRRWHIVPPSKPKNPTHRPKNPPVEQRVRLVNKLMATNQLMVDTMRAPKSAEAFKDCELKLGKYGKVHPHGYYAHLTDAAGYVCWWAIPKPTVPHRSDTPLGVILPSQQLQVY
jgi:hypothetical protein